MCPYSIGLGLGTNYCRSLIVDVISGRELASPLLLRCNVPTHNGFWEAESGDPLRVSLWENLH